MPQEINHFDNALYRSIEQFFFASKVNEEEYIVINLENKKQYTVNAEKGFVFSCSCPHHQHRGVVCKHMIRVCNEYELKLPI